ncbi:MAG: formyltransferase family protein, partial [Candidatus Thermoplasmatota archaeon]|nr:formyltransferase family protein [Candidatus Thermoplasmatota archaeon]
MNEGRWIEFTDSGEVIELSEMPQPEGWRYNRIEALPTIHTIPSCAWKLSTARKKGKFNRQRAIELGLPIISPNNIRKQIEIKEEIKNMDADIYLVVAFGQILPVDLLNQPPLGSWNCHASLLPRWRGA